MSRSVFIADATCHLRAACCGCCCIGFAQWYARYQAGQRRDMRRTVKELFEGADVDGTGILDKSEFTALVLKVEQDATLPDISKHKQQMDLITHDAHQVRCCDPCALACTAVCLVARVPDLSHCLLCFSVLSARLQKKTSPRSPKSPKHNKVLVEEAQPPPCSTTGQHKFTSCTHQ